MSRPFQFSLGRLMMAMTLLSVAAAFASMFAREPRPWSTFLLVNTSTWTLLGLAAIFADERTNAAAIVLAVVGMIAFGFFVCPS